MARQRKMTPERKAFINSLLEHYQLNDARDMQEMLKDLLEDTLQGMPEAEMISHMTDRILMPITMQNRKHMIYNSYPHSTSL